MTDYFLANGATAKLYKVIPVFVISSMTILFTVANESSKGTTIATGVTVGAVVAVTVGTVVGLVIFV